MATEVQAPDAILASAGLSGTVADIDDDPDSPDGAWLTAGQNASTSVRVSFPTPTGNPTAGSGLQEFRVLLRKTATNGGKIDDTWAIWLWENGSSVAELASGANVPAAGQVYAGTWDAASLGTADGSLVEFRVVCTPETSGSPGSRGSIEVGAVEWNVDYGGAPPAADDGLFIAMLGAS